MQRLIDAKLVTVRRENMWLEIEINTDILFPSGVGAFSSCRRTGARQAGGGAEALPQSDPRRRAHRRSADSHRGIPLQLGTVGGARSERGASVHTSRASIRCGSRSSASANFIRAKRMTRRGTQRESPRGRLGAGGSGSGRSHDGADDDGHAADRGARRRIGGWRERRQSDAGTRPARRSWKNRVDERR